MGDPLAAPDPAARLSTGASPAPPVPARPPIEPGSRQAMVGGSIAAIAAVVVGVMFFVMSHPKIRIPDQIGGAPRLETVEAQRLERLVEWTAGMGGVDAEAAFYSDGSAVLALVVGEDDSAVDAEQALRDFSRGLESSNPQTTVRLTRLRAETRAGVSYACAPTTGQLGGSVCAWKDPDTHGFLLALQQPVRRVLDLTTTTHDSVRG